MLKKSLVSPARPKHAETRLFPCSVLASFRSSTLKRSFSEVGSNGGAFPLAKIYSKGERPTQSAVCTSLGPSLAAALLGTRRVSARRGWEGEKDELFERPVGSCLLF